MIDEAMATSEDAARAALYHYAVQNMGATAETVGDRPEAASATAGVPSRVGDAAAPQSLQERVEAVTRELLMREDVSAESRTLRPVGVDGADYRAAESPFGESPWEPNNMWLRAAHNLQIYLE